MSLCTASEPPKTSFSWCNPVSGMRVKASDPFAHFDCRSVTSSTAYLFKVP